MKKRILILLLLAAVPAWSAQQTLNNGSAPNDGTGDTLRTASTKINANFTELYGKVTGLTIASGKTLTVSNTITLTATDGTTINLSNAVLTTGSYSNPAWITALAGSKLSGAYTAAGMTMATARLLGRTTASSGTAEEISIGSGLSMSGGTLSAPNLSGTNTGDQTITLTGDATGSGTGSFAVTIATGAVTSGKILDGTIVNADINGSAAIANSKLANSAITIAGTSTSLGGSMTASAILDSISSTQGAVLYRGASGWVALSPGTSGQFLKTNGASANPAWAAAGGFADPGVAYFASSGSGGDGTPGNPYGPGEGQTAYDAGKKNFRIGAGCDIGNLEIFDEVFLIGMGGGAAVGTIKLTATTGVHIGGFLYAEKIDADGADGDSGSPNGTNGFQVAVYIEATSAIGNLVSAEGGAAFDDGMATMASGGNGGTIVIYGAGQITAVNVAGASGVNGGGNGGGGSVVPYGAVIGGVFYPNSYP